MSQRQVFWDRILGTAESINSTSYYDLLGIDQAADADGVREAYYGLVRTHHPDRHARESSERIHALTVVYARIGEAYRVLANPAMRQKYDRGLAAGKQRQIESSRRELGNQREPKTAQGIQLFQQGKQALAAKDKRGARARWELALQYDPDSKAIQEALASLASTEADPAVKTTPATATRPEPARRTAPVPETRRSR